MTLWTCGRYIGIACLILVFWPVILMWRLLKFVVLVVLPLIGILSLLGAGCDDEALTGS